MNPQIVPLAVFTLSIFGLSYVLGQAKISYPLRVRLDPGNQVDSAGKFARWWLLELLECNACSSWWLGLGAWAAHLTPPELPWWFCSFYCCATSLILAQIAGLNNTHSES